MTSRRLPPYARELAEARRQGLVPQTTTGWFLVCLGWGVHRRVASGELWPRVVLPLDVAIQDYDLRPLAGLDLLLVYDLSDAGRVPEVVDCLFSAHPRTLEAWGLPADGVEGMVAMSWQARGETLLPGVRESWA